MRGDPLPTSGDVVVALMHCCASCRAKCPGSCKGPLLHSPPHDACFDGCLRCSLFRWQDPAAIPDEDADTEAMAYITQHEKRSKLAGLWARAEVQELERDGASAADLCDRTDPSSSTTAKVRGNVDACPTELRLCHPGLFYVRCFAFVAAMNTVSLCRASGAMYGCG